MFLGVLAAAAVAASPVLVSRDDDQDRAGTATTAVVAHHIDRHPVTVRAAKVALQRLGDAAMEACGASSFSLREVQADVRASPCWRRSMADAVARIGDPMLIAAYTTSAR